MSALQKRLTEFLFCDLAHSLGAYSNSAMRLTELEHDLRRERLVRGQLPKYGSAWRDGLVELVGISAHYARRLDRLHDRAIIGDPKFFGADDGLGLHRHPLPPSRLPLRSAPRFGDQPDDVEGPVDDPTRSEIMWPGQFYRAAIAALELDCPSGWTEDHADSARWTDDDALRHLQRAILQPRNLGFTDPHAAGERQGVSQSQSREGKRRENRLQRLRDRLATWERLHELEVGRETTNSTREREMNARVARLVMCADLESGPDGTSPVHQPLPLFVVRALVDGHFGLHVAVAHNRRPLREVLRGATADVGPQARKHIHLSIELLTFVRTAVRTAPHMFAETSVEREFMQARREGTWQHVVPARAMWIGTQVGILALYRRGHAFALLGDRHRAYNDFHKLQGDVRDATRRLKTTALHVAGAMEFLQSIDALCNYQIGELYRADRQFQGASLHFIRARKTFERLGEHEPQREIIKNARWRVHLYLGLGKTYYELGRHKLALLWFLRSWQALLELVAADTASEAENDALEQAINELWVLAEEPRIYMTDVRRFMAPIVEQIEASYIDPRFIALASDVLLRLGQLLLVIRVDRPAPNDRRRGELAARVLLRAAELDEGSTLALSALFRLERGFAAEFSATIEAPGAEAASDTGDGRAPVPLGGPEDSGFARHRSVADRVRQQITRSAAVIEQSQWPGGASHLESLARAVELAVLSQIAAGDTHADVETAAARRLLEGFLSHTDSIEARRSQVHRHLTERREVQTSQAEPHIEFVCLRRYSSAFPMIPRAETARSHGGGYFVRVHSEGRTVGLVIDPGTSFVDCLFRSPYSLSDIDGIIVTHDHVDHAAMLEPLLSMFHEAAQLDPSIVEPWVLGNASIVARLKAAQGFEDELAPAGSAIGTGNPRLGGRRLLALTDRRDCQSAAEWVAEKLNGGAADDVGFSVVAVSSAFTVKGAEQAHYDFHLNPACGLRICLTHGNAEASLFLGSDVPWRHAEAKSRNKAGLAAAIRSSDIVVAHVSTAPLAEMRKLARLREATGVEELIEARDRVTSATLEMWATLEGPNNPIRRRLEYAHWLGSAAGMVEPVEDLRGSTLGDGAPLQDWLPPASHLFLRGLLGWAKLASAGATPNKPGRVILVGELSEELGSFRRRIADELNKILDAQPADGNALRALTTDIGLRVQIVPSEPGQRAGVAVCCSSCELDNDCAEAERWHRPEDIREVCVKSENEGIFYNCEWHDPGQAERGEEAFLEKFERYDTFGA